MYPGRCGSNFQCINIEHNLEIDIMTIQVNITLDCYWMSEDPVDDNSILV